MKKNAIQRLILLLPLAIIAALNLAGTFMAVNLNDFQAFVDAGRAVVSGQNPYGNAWLGISTNLNPPLSFFFLPVLAPYDVVQSYQVWRVISLVMYVISFVMLLRAYRQYTNIYKTAWAFCFMAIWYTLLLGQLYVLLLFVSVCAWLLLKSDRQVAAGLLIGCLVALKPNFLFWPFLLFLIGWYPAAISAVAMAAGLTLVSLLAFGPQVFSDWLFALKSCPGIAYPGNSSLFGLAARFGFPGMGVFVATALLAAVSLLTWRKKPPVLEASSLAIVGMLLATPFVWSGYYILLLPVFLSRKWTPLLIITAVLLTVPEIFIATAEYYIPLGRQIAGAIYPVALILVLIELVLTGRNAWVESRQS